MTVTLKPIARLSSTELKKSHSIELVAKKEDKINEILSKKLVKKEKKKMQT